MKAPQSRPTPIEPAQPTPIIDRSLMVILSAHAAALTAGAAIAQVQKMLGL